MSSEAEIIDLEPPQPAAEKEQIRDRWLLNWARRSLQKRGVWGHSILVILVITLGSVIITLGVYHAIGLEYLSEPIAMIMPVILPILTGLPVVVVVNRLFLKIIDREQEMLRQQEKLRLLAEENARQRKAAEAASAAKSALLANMSHELRTPLNAIIGFSDIFQNEMFDRLSRGQIRQYAMDINVSGRLLLSLVNDLLELARIEAGGREFEPETVHVPQKIAEVCRIVTTQADEAGVTLEIAEGDPDLTIETDDRALRQMLLNLLSNAIKFTPKDGSVTIRAEAQHRFIALSVQDTGIGIRPAELQRIFEPFRQVDNSYTRAKTGTGLGLALVRSMIEQQGGRIEAESTEGKGSTFTLLFPYIGARVARPRKSAPKAKKF